MQPFLEGQKVAIQNSISKEWTLKSVIWKKVAPGSFDIKLYNERVLHRNQHHICRIFTVTASSLETELIKQVPTGEINSSLVENTAETNAGDLNISTETVPYVDDSFETISYDEVKKEEGTYISEYGLCE